MIELVLKDGLEFKNPIVIEGFPGVGLVGHIAATYLVNELDMPEIGFIKTDMIPQIAMILNGKVLPPVRIYGTEELVVFVSDLAFPDEKTYHMATAIGGFMKDVNVSTSISLAGIGLANPTGKVFGVGSDDTMLSKLTNADVEVLSMGSISGGSGALLLECAHQNIPSLALLVETYGNRPDPRGASLMLEKIGNLIDKKFNTEPLLQEAEQIESTLTNLSNDVEKQSTTDKFDTMYI